MTTPNTGLTTPNSPPVADHPNMARCFGGPLNGEWWAFSRTPVGYRPAELPLIEVASNDTSVSTARDVPPVVYGIAKYGFLLPRPPYRVTFYAWVPEGSAMARRIELILQALTAWANHGLAP